MKQQTTANLEDRSYQIVFENFLEATIPPASKLNIVKVNRQTCNLFGYTRKKMLTLNANFLFTTKAINENIELLKSSPEKKVLAFEAEAIRKNGTSIPLSVLINMVDITKCEFALLSIRELTERREFQRERDQLLEQLRREKEDLAALSEITPNAINTLCLDELPDVLPKQLVQVIKADNVVILLKKENQLRVRTGANTRIEEEVSSGYAMSIGQGFAGPISATLKPLFIDDAQVDPRVISPFIKERGTRTMLGVLLNIIAILSALFTLICPAFIPIIESIVGKLKEAELFSPGGIQVPYSYPETAAVVVDRHIFDGKLGETVLNLGFSTGE